MNRPVIVLGSGGHAKVLVEALRLRSIEILGVTDPAPQMDMEGGLKYLGDDSAVLKFKTDDILLVNGIGSVNTKSVRRSVFEKFKKLGYEFLTVSHPSAIISPHSQLREGAQVMAGAVIQIGACVGENSIINTRASIDHDCEIGSHVHVAPGAVLCGGVMVGDGCHIGAGAVVIQGLHIGRSASVGAGSLVTGNVADGGRARRDIEAVCK